MVSSSSSVCVALLGFVLVHSAVSLAIPFTEAPNTGAPAPCCTPDHWTSESWEVKGNKTVHTKEFYSATQQKMLTLVTSATENQIILFDFPNTTLYVLFENNGTRTCSHHPLFGGWHSMCVGPHLSESFSSSINVAGAIADVWYKKTQYADRNVTVTRTGCVPVLEQANGAVGDMTMFYNFDTSALPKGTFDVPVECRSLSTQPLDVIDLPHNAVKWMHWLA